MSAQANGESGRQRRIYKGYMRTGRDASVAFEVRRATSSSCVQTDVRRRLVRDILCAGRIHCRVSDSATEEGCCGCSLVIEDSTTPYIPGHALSVGSRSGTDVKNQYRTQGLLNYLLINTFISWIHSRCAQALQNIGKIIDQVFSHGGTSWVPLRRRAAN
jgi:hypothetical protein